LGRGPNVAKGAILCGFKVQVPLTPEDRLLVLKIAKGLGLLRDRAAKIPRFLTQQGDNEIIEGLEALRVLAVSLLAASSAAAGRSSPTPRS
jgi:hypothetical protein